MERAPARVTSAWSAAGLGLVLVVLFASLAIRHASDELGAVLGAVRGVHRAAASLEVVAALALTWLAWRRALGVAVLTVFLSVLGIAVGQNPPPAAAAANLLGGLALAAAFAWLLGRAQGHAARAARRLGHAVAALFVAQCALGAWLAIFAEDIWGWVLAGHVALGLGLAAGAAWLALRLERAAQRFALLGLALAVVAAGAAAALFGQPLAASLAHGAAGALLAAAAAYAHARLT
ncbi:MAG TPA: hypothetical protein VLA30_15235 [Burkholderiales bacterium]|nr:hypothetical protein [Burkholderiales bacterium]